MLRKKFIMFFVVVLVIMGTVLCSYGANYPTRPVEILVGYTPGSSLDLYARILAEIMPKYLGQPMVVVNKPGAGGALVAGELISSKPDGYKIMQTTDHFFALTSKTQKLSFDPFMLTPIGAFVTINSGLTVRGDSVGNTWKNFNDFIEYAKKNPNKIRWGHSGNGTQQHIFGTLMFKQLGVQLIDVPYKGTVDKITAMLGNHLEAATQPVAALMEHVRAGKIKFLMTLGDKRDPDMPDVPCAAELGLPDIAKLGSTFGLVMHKDNPPEIQKTLIDAFKKTFDDPEFKKKIKALGEEPVYSSPEQTKNIIKKSEEILTPVLKELGLYVQR